MVRNNRRLVVLYGSETGTAENYARLIASEVRRFKFSALIASMDEFSFAAFVDASEALVTPVCFVCSTTGQGDDPENMRTFWRNMLKRTLPGDLLQNVIFGVLAFGDSSYAKFNFAGKKLHRRLLQLGARCFQEIGLCDDQHEFGPEAVAGPWIEEMFSKLVKEFPLGQTENAVPAGELLPPTIQAVAINDIAPAITEIGGVEKFGFQARVTSNERVTPVSHWQDTRLLSFSIPDSVSYGPGDVAALYPENLAESQESFLTIFGLKRNMLVELKPVDPGQTLPNRLSRFCTVDYLVSNYWDLNCRPGINFFRLFSQLASDELESEKLSEFCSKEGQDDFIDYCIRPRRTVIEVFQDFPKTTAQLHFSYLFDLLSPIKPRSFSIASNFKTHGNVLQLLVAVVCYKTRMAKERLGLCSNWMARLLPDQKLRMQIKRGSMKLPNLKIPCIFVAPGTGIAPLRNMIFERVSTDPESPDANVLFFGFRSVSSDFYFADDFKELANRNVLKMFTAPSRDGKEKRYVQHVIRENSKLVADLLLQNGAFVFICGNAKDMPAAVKDAICDCLVSEIGDCKDFVAALEKKGRLQLETWS